MKSDSLEDCRFSMSAMMEMLIPANRLGRMIATKQLTEKTKRIAHKTATVAVVVYNELWRTRVFTIAAALAFYFLLSLVPLLIVFASLLWYLPATSAVSQLLNIMAALIPADSARLVQAATLSVLGPGHTSFLSFGILSYLWAATGGFSVLIESLDIAYDVTDCRSWWRQRLQAFLLTFTVGGLGMLSLLALVVGPHFGHFLSLFFPVPEVFAHIWPFLRWIITIATFVSGLELMYYLGPHARHSFWSTLPGAAFAVAMWFLGSFGLSFYLTNIANYNKTYGSLGAVIALMLWLYISSLAVLIGAELNAEIGKARRARD